MKEQTTEKEEAKVKTAEKVDQSKQEETIAFEAKEQILNSLVSTGTKFRENEKKLLDLEKELILIGSNAMMNF